MDIGGTNTVFGVVDSRGNVLASDSVKTQQYENIEEYVEAVCKNSFLCCLSLVELKR